MRNIQDTLHLELKDQLKFYKDKRTISVLRLIKSEFQRERSKEVSDERAVKIISELVKSQEEIIKVSSDFIVTNDARHFIRVANELLPAEVSLDDVEAWIKVNIDFDNLNNKMQAIGIVKKHFGVTIDGNAVKEMITSM